MANPNTRMTNRKPTNGVGNPHDDGHKALHDQQQAQTPAHRSPQDQAAAIDAAEHGRDAQPAGKPDQQQR